MKRLWIITELFPPEESATGYIMGEIAKALSKKYDVGVICGPEVYDSTRKKSDVNIKDFKFPIYRTNTATFNKNSFIGKVLSFSLTTLNLYRLSKQLINEEDKVLVVTNPATLIPLMGRLKKKKHFNLTILVHDVFPENTKAAGVTLPMFRYIKSIFDKAYSQADRLIVLGRDMADKIRQKTNGNVPIQIIENWGDFNQIIPLPMPESDKIILQYAGNIGRVQGLEEFIINIPNNIEFHLYGSGAIEKNLKDLNKKNVFFHGPYKRDEQSEILGACHISLITLNKNMYGLGTPSKTYNILAAGRPILYMGPPNTEIALLVQEHKIGYLGFPNKWDVNELKVMGNKARKIGERYFTKETIIDKFIHAI